MKNRELKFRVYNGIEMIDNVTSGKFGSFYVNPEKGDGLNPKDTASLTMNTTKYHDSTPIMQLTGLPFNIYEGDIIKPKNNTSVFVVLWNEHNCCFSAFNKYEYEQIISGDDLSKLNTINNKGNINREWILKHEITPIGNIYENAEMLVNEI